MVGVLNSGSRGPGWGNYVEHDHGVVLKNKIYMYMKEQAKDNPQ